MQSVISDSLQTYGLLPTRLLCPWDSPGKSTGMGFHTLLQGMVPTQESNPGLLHCRKILYQLGHQGNMYPWYGFQVEKSMAPHSSTLAWKIPWTEERGRLQSMRSLRVGHNWETSLSLFTFMHGEGNGSPLWCSCLESPRDGGAWWIAVYGVAHSRTLLKQLSSSSSSVAFKRQVKCKKLKQLKPKD